MIMLCVLMYVRTGCGLRTIVSILGIFEEVLGPSFRKAPSYNTVRNWVLKLGLSVYSENTSKDLKKFSVIVDESIMINKEKLLLVLGFNSEHVKRPLQHKDMVVLEMKVGASFYRTDVKNEIDRISENMGSVPEYGISDGAHNLVGGFKDANIRHHLDISHTLGNCMKKAYGKDADFESLTTKLGQIRLQYHLTDKAWLLPPNMRAIARFMNLQDWVVWASRMLDVYDSLDGKMKEAYAFLLSYRELINELSVSVNAIRYTEGICKNEGFSKRTFAICKDHIIRNVIGNAYSRRVKLGLKMIEYFNKQKALLGSNEDVHNISSDIIESDFGIYKAKKSPNKLYGITSLVLMLPLYPKITEYSVTDKQDFKVRLANVKPKDIDSWAKKNLYQNRVSLRTKTLRNVG